MKRPLKIGLIGCGRWGKNILRDLLRLNCIVEVAETTQEKREAALRLGATKAHASFEEMEQVDGYIVAVQTVHHFKIVLALLETGKPIFVEKPLTNDLELTKLLSEKEREQVFVMHKWRYHPAIQKMKEIIQRKKYGKVLSIDIRRQQWTIPHIDVDATWILLPHDLSILFHLLGTIPSVTWATGLKNKADWIYNLCAHLGQQPTCSITVSSTYAIDDRSIHVLMENGALLMNDSLADYIQIRPCNFKEKQAIEKISIDTEWPLFLELKNFVEHIQGGPPPMSSIPEEVKIIESLEAIRAFVLKNAAEV